MTTMQHEMLMYGMDWNYNGQDLIKERQQQQQRMMKRPKITDKLQLSAEDANDHSGINDLTGNSMLLNEPNDENLSAYLG